MLIIFQLRVRLRFVYVGDLGCVGAFLEGEYRIGVVWHYSMFSLINLSFELGLYLLVYACIKKHLKTAHLW